MAILCLHRTRNKIPVLKEDSLFKDLKLIKTNQEIGGVGEGKNPVTSSGLIY